MQLKLYRSKRVQKPENPDLDPDTDTDTTHPVRSMVHKILHNRSGPVRSGPVQMLTPTLTSSKQKKSSMEAMNQEIVA